MGDLHTQSNFLAITTLFMVWLPFSAKSLPPAAVSPQVEQRSHQPLGIAPVQSDIEHTLSQLSTEDSQPRVHVLSAESRKETNDSVSEFVTLRPKSMFIIDGEKYGNESIICTSDALGKTCLKLKYNLIELFKQMQRLEYFCLLPNDIDATYFECRKIM